MRARLRFLPVMAVMMLSACSPKADNDAGSTVTLAQPRLYSASEKAAILTTFPAPYNTADLAAGEKQYNKCRACHTITPDSMNLTGPHLYGLFGRKAATASGYTFSEGMTKHAVIWDFGTLDTFIKAPQQTVKGTKMGYFGIQSDTDRHNLIAFLALETTIRPPVATDSASAN